MGVCDLSPSNEYFQEKSNIININKDRNDAIETKPQKSSHSKKITQKNNNNNNKNVDLKKKILEINTKRIIDTNKINNIFNSKSNYANYKRVPHLKSKTDNILPTEKKDNHIKNNHLLINQINPEENNLLWFKTQYNNFNNIKESNMNNIKNITNINNINNYHNNDSNIRVNLNVYKNKNLLNNKVDNKSKIIYTKALPMDYNNYNNEKKIENLFIIRNKYNFKDNNLDNLLYVLEKDDSLKISNSNIKTNIYSTKKEYNNIIKRFSNNKLILSNYLLEIKERHWYNELIDITNILKKKRAESDILISNKYLRKITKLQEHFKWLIESLGIFFNILIFGKENKYNFNYNNDFNLPTKDKMKWFNGFKWKGIFIKVITNEKSKILINEIKALNYFYFDYLQLLDQFPYIQDNQLLYQIIFPMIAYTEINGFFLFSSVIININDFSKQQNYSYTINELVNINEIIKNNNGIINFLGEKYKNNIKRENSFYVKNDKCICDLENKYYIKELMNSKLFGKLNLYHFIRINKKFMIFNLYEFIPKLFQLTINNDYKINYISLINDKRVYFKTEIKNTINTKIKDNISNNIKTNNNSFSKEILNKLNFIFPSLSQLKSKDIMINNIYFRIIYEAQYIKENHYKNKHFVDYLYNYNNYNSENNKSENFIVEPYIILYDLKDSIKLKYSLIKSFYNKENVNKNNNNLNYIIDNLFYISTNYISFFTSWCESLNKNSYNIKSYSDLKYSMNKYGISSQLKFFSLININNSEILDIIKISLLVKIIKFVFNKKDNDNILYKLNDIKNNNIDLNKFSEYRKTKILYIIKSILYPNEIINQSKHFFSNLYEDLLFYVNVIFLKLKLIDGYLSLGLLNINKTNNLNMNINNICKKISGFESPKNFLKHIIKIARDKPFLFLNEMEYKLKFIIDPFIKFKSSISIESMYEKLELNHIYLSQNNKTYSYINSGEISGLILSKLIYYNININNSHYNNNSKINLFDCHNNINDFKNEINNQNKNNNNIALKPNYMKAIINLNSYKSPIKSKENIFLSPQINSDTESIGNKNEFLMHMKKGNSSELFLSMSDKKNVIHNNNDFYKLTNIMEKEICDNFIFELPSICYKMNYSIENTQPKSKKVFYKYLKNIYFIPELKIIKKWQTYIDKIFYGISSSNGRIEYSLFISLVYLFIITFFYEKNFKEANQINMKIKDIFKKGNYQLSLISLSIINLFQALSIEKYIESEAPYSKCLLLLLISYGEPRGRNNDSHGILEFPLWKIARKTRLEQKIINDYFKEMLHCLSFYEKKKCFLKFINTKGLFNYSNNVYNNVDNFKILNEIYHSKYIKINNRDNNDEFQNMNNELTISDILNNNISENPGLDFFTFLSKITNNLDISLNSNIFEDIFLNKKVIKTFNFPPVSCTIEKLDKIFFQKDFILYFLKQIQSLLVSEKVIYNEEYINENISDEIFYPYPYNYNNKITCITNESDTNDDYTAEDINYNCNKKANNCSICTHKAKILQMEKNDFFPFPSNTNFIYNFIEDKKNQTQKNKIVLNDLSLSPFKEKKRTSMVNSSIIINKNKEKIKSKNKSVESIRKTKNNLFSHFLYNEILQKLSFKLNIQSGAVISFGNNTHNETSHDNYEKITLPRMIFKLKNIRIEHIYSGWEHNILISNKGEIFSFGNNKHYQCGLSNEDNKCKIIKDPTNISILNHNIKGISAACGNEHSLILSDKNEVYAFGNNEDGALALNDNKIKSYKFTKINFGKYTNKIKDISAGTVHSLALTNDNKIFSWGSSQGGQLGLTENYLLSQPGYKNSFVLSNPSLIEYFSKNNKIYKKTEVFVKISCGEAHSIALNNRGKVYSWGFGSNGQLGLGFCEDSFEPGSGLFKSRKFIPEIIEYLEDETIIDIKCGKTFTMFINDKNELYACGVNDLNQLGINEPCPKEHLINKEISCYDFVFPTKVDCFLNMKVLKISCGEGHCLAVIKDLISNIQTIWSWGNNNNGQLGQGSFIKKSTPNPINYLSEYNSKKFDDISCGGFHSLCLINYKEKINWIEEDYNTIIKIIDEIGNL